MRCVCHLCHCEHLSSTTGRRDDGTMGRRDDGIRRFALCEAKHEIAIAWPARMSFNLVLAEYTPAPYPYRAQNELEQILILAPCMT